MDIGSSDDLASFQAAVEFLNTSNELNISSQDKLFFYSQFKQATCGPCNIAKPGMFDFVGRAKWEAWKALGQQSKEESRKKYVQLLKTLYPSWNSNVHDQREDNRDSPTIKRKGGDNSLGGPVFSRMQLDNSETNKKIQDVYLWVQEGNIEKLEEELAEKRSLGIDVGQFLDTKDENGLAAIHYASDRNHPRVIEILLNSGANVNLQDSEGQTAAHYASIIGNMEVLKMLFKYGIDLTVKDAEGRSAEEVACDSEIAALIRSVSTGSKASAYDYRSHNNG